MNVIFMTLFLFSSPSVELEFVSGGQEPASERAFAKAKLPGTLVLPHLPANDQFKTQVYFRNDAPFTRVVKMFFRTSGEDYATVSIDSPSGPKQGQLLTLRLPPGFSYWINLNSIEGAGSCYAIAYVDSSAESPAEGVAIEALYSKIINGRKIGAVGAHAAHADYKFRMTVDGNRDPFTGKRREKGLAIVGALSIRSPICDLTLKTDEGDTVDQTQFQLDGAGRWLGMLGDLVDLSKLDGLGYVECDCTAWVSPLALEFEGDVFTSSPAPSL